MIREEFQNPGHCLPARIGIRGFSLVEVMFALAICSIGLLLTIAILPTVLSQLGDAADRNAYARIKQSVSARYAMMDWGSLEESARAGETERFFFDFAGIEVDESSREAIYAVEVSVRDRRTLPGDSSPNRFVRSLEIKVSQAIGNEEAFTRPALHDTLSASLGNEERLSDDYRD